MGCRLGGKPEGSKKRPSQITVWRRPREKGWGGAIEGREGGQRVLPEADLNGVVNTQYNMQRMKCRLPRCKPANFTHLCHPPVSKIKK